MAALPWLASADTMRRITTSCMHAAGAGCRVALLAVPPIIMVQQQEAAPHPQQQQEAEDEMMPMEFYR